MGGFGSAVKVLLREIFAVIFFTHMICQLSLRTSFTVYQETILCTSNYQVVSEEYISSDGTIIIIITITIIIITEIEEDTDSKSCCDSRQQQRYWRQAVPGNNIMQ